MNIDITKKVNTSTVSAGNTTQTVSKENNGKFAEELKTLSAEKKKTSKVDSAEKTEKVNNSNKTEVKSSNTSENVKSDKTEAAKNDSSEKQVNSELNTDDKTDNKLQTEKTEIPPEDIQSEFENIGEVKELEAQVAEILNPEVILKEKNEKTRPENEFSISQSGNTEVAEPETVKPEITKEFSEKISKEQDLAPKTEIKPEAQLSVAGKEQNSELDNNITEAEKAAKHQKPAKPEAEHKEMKKSDLNFDDFVRKEEITPTEKLTQKSETINVNEEIDENIAATTKVINGLQNAVKEIKKITKDDTNLNLHLKDEKPEIEFEKKVINVDKNSNASVKKEEKQEEKELIDNNINIQENKDVQLPQMNANMNFNSNGQPFSEFVNPKKEQEELKSTKKDLAEEEAILSTMAENIAIANKNIIQQPDKNEKTSAAKPEVKIVKPAAKQDTLANILSENEDNSQEVLAKTKTVTTEEGIKKVDRKTNVVVETVVKYDTVVMDKNDVDFFAKLVDKGEIEMADVQNSQKSSQVSKTLADLLAKSMQDNKPIRIDFDNNISVIIKIGRDGKISADFLPSSQVAEAYLKENLPILKQRFDDNNIEYDELNQRKQQNKQDSQENRRKGRKDE